jgi:hypothetical protein
MIVQSPAVVITAILGVVVLGSVGLLTGYDGTLVGLCLSVVAGLGSFSLGRLARKGA